MQAGYVGLLTAISNFDPVSLLEFPRRGRLWLDPEPCRLVRPGSGLAVQDLRGRDRFRGLVSFHGERAAEVGTDGEAAV